MPFRPFSGPWSYRHQKKKASTAFTQGALVDLVDGFFEVCVITRAPHYGIATKTVVSTDADYASATRLPLMVPQSPLTEWRASVLSSDTAAATDVGNFFDIGGSPVGIDVTRATSNDDAFCVTRFVSANEVIGWLNSFKAQQPGIGTAT